MDDWLESCMSEEETAKYVHETIEINKHGNWEIY